MYDKWLPVSDVKSSEECQQRHCTFARAMLTYAGCFDASRRGLLAHRPQYPRRLECSESRATIQFTDYTKALSRSHELNRLDQASLQNHRNDVWFLDMLSTPRYGIAHLQAANRHWEDALLADGFHVCPGQTDGLIWCLNHYFGGSSKIYLALNHPEVGSQRRHRILSADTDGKPRRRSVTRTLFWSGCSSALPTYPIVLLQ